MTINNTFKRTSKKYFFITTIIHSHSFILTQSTEKLVAFMFGFISHQVADISWHSLAGFQQGFLQAMANVNFHGDFNAAHSDGDVGGDMLTQLDRSDLVIPQVEW